MTFKIRKLSTGKVTWRECPGCPRCQYDLIKLPIIPDVEIDAEELTLTSSEIDAMLAREELRSTDLVQIDGCWMSLADSPYFGDAAAPVAARESQVRWLKAVGGLALIVLAYAAMPEAISFVLRVLRVAP
ncbi:MAG: hypothetical protein QM817_03270 [Archangium sp.]